MNKSHAIFVDRDGVINHDYGYTYKWSDFVFIDGCIDALIILKNLGFLIFIITNQSGIGRGYYTHDDFSKLNRQMLDYLKKNDVSIKEVYYCPHLPSENCVCRKPAPGLILQAEKDHNIDLRQSCIIGDKLSDIEAGLEAGVGMQILVGCKGAPASKLVARYRIAENLLEAAKQIALDTR